MWGSLFSVFYVLSCILESLFCEINKNNNYICRIQVLFFLCILVISLYCTPLIFVILIALPYYIFSVILNTFAPNILYS